jgi:AcrR family transcriptional regulator
MPHPSRIDTAAILACARELLESGGAEGVTMRELARRLGVRAPSLYFHVPNREHILVALIDTGLAELGQALEAAVSADEPRATAHNMVDAYLGFAEGNPRLFTLVFGPCPVEGPNFVPGQDAASRALLGAVAGIAAPGDVVAVAQVLWSLVHGFASLMLAGQFRLPQDPRVALHTGVDLLLDGLALADRRSTA